MVFRLHVWGPAFGLASIDAECLATITYLAHTLPASEWALVASSPSGVPTHSLPALQDSVSDAWTSGFTDIVSQLSSQNPNWNLDEGLSAAQKADFTAYSTFLVTNAAPLIALSLYVSSANWIATTRPAYSNVLPVPLTWTEPPVIRSSMADKAEHLGLSSLDTDADALSESKTDDDGWIKVPAALRLVKRGVSSSLTPEQAAHIRLDGLARECLTVLSDLKGSKRFFLTGADADADSDSNYSSKPTALDCLAFGYLALMLVPEVPRPWLRSTMRRRFESLCLFVDHIGHDCFGGDVLSGSLPWRKQTPSESGLLALASRFAQGVLRTLPSVGEDWHRWATARPADDEGKPWKQRERDNSPLLAALGGVAGVGLVGGLLWYRHMSPFGSAIYRWQMQRPGMGAAGALFGF